MLKQLILAVMTHSRALHQLRPPAVITAARRLFDALNAARCLSTTGGEQHAALNLSHLTVLQLLHVHITQEKDTSSTPHTRLQ